MYLHQNCFRSAAVAAGLLHGAVSWGEKSVLICSCKCTFFVLNVFSKFQQHSAAFRKPSTPDRALSTPSASWKPPTPKHQITDLPTPHLVFRTSTLAVLRTTTRFAQDVNKTWCSQSTGTETYTNAQATVAPLVHKLSTNPPFLYQPRGQTRDHCAQ